MNHTIMSASLFFGVLLSLPVGAQEEPPPLIPGTDYYRQFMREMHAHSELAAHDYQAINNPQLLHSIELMRNGNGLGVLEVADFQKKEIIDLLNDLETQVEHVERKYAQVVPASRQHKLIHEDVEQLRATVSKKIAELLMPFQRQEILKWTPDQMGIAKLLTETPLGDGLELTERQKRDIRIKANKVAERIGHEILALRKEAADDVLGELSMAQLDKLREIYGSDLEELFNSNIHDLERQLDYPDDE